MNRSDGEQRKLGTGILRFVWTGMFVVMLAYTGIILLHHHSHESPPTEGKEGLIWIFVVLGSLSLFLAFWIQKKIETYFTRQIITWGLMGSLSVYGLVLGLIGFSPWVWGSFFLVMSVGLFSQRPQRSQTSVGD